MKSYPDEPTVPDPPVERNIFRRFFSWIGLAKHTKEYNDSMEKRQQAIKDRDVYRKAKETIESALNAAADDPLMKKAAVQQGRIESLFAAKKRDLDRVRMKLADSKALKNIADSKAAVFTEGSVSAMLDVIHNRPLMAEKIRKTEAPKKDTEAVENFAKYHHVDQIEVDDTPTDDVNKLVTLVSPLKAGIAAHDAEIAGPEYRNEIFNNEVKKEYAEMVDDAKRAFRENFGLEASPANVQAVADTFKLDEYVKYGVERIDKKIYGDEDKLPKVDANNVGDITFLLMSGIKTVAVMGNLVKDTDVKKPEKQPVVNNAPQLAPASEAEGSQLGR